MGMTQLTYLLLYDNKLSGTLPTELGLMTQLTYLYLELNMLTGPLPTELGLMTQLTYLWLYNNQLNGTANEIFCVDGVTTIVYVDCEKIACRCCRNYNPGYTC